MATIPRNTSERYYSLDVFRGATVAFMILVNNQMSEPYAPLDHAPWNGLTPTDLVFPFFLFAVGNALSFVMPRFRQSGDGVFFRKVCKRAALIFGIGLLLNWFPFVRWSHGSLVFKSWTWTTDDGRLAGVRIMGVLARIALCYFFAACIIYWGHLKRSVIAGGVLLFGYWGLCYSLGTPGDPYSISGYFGTAIDKFLFGEPHMYHGEGIAFDPEGLASTLAAITQVIFGYWVGWFIQKNGKELKTFRTLAIAAVALLAVGYGWNFWFPVNKKIWTSSYVLVSTGYAIGLLLCLMYLVERRQFRGAWSRFFDVFGKNPLFIFVLSGVLPRLLGLVHIAVLRPGATKITFESPLGWFYDHVCRPLTGFHNKSSSLLYSAILVCLFWLIGWVLDRKKIYVRV